MTGAAETDKVPLKDIKGKLCVDKGYIGQTLFENLFLNVMQLIIK